jgi:hypothetical protein
LIRNEVTDRRAGAARLDSERDQAFGKKYFLMLSPSVLNTITLPVAVTLKRFLAPDLVFSLGIWLSYGRGKDAPEGRFRS